MRILSQDGRIDVPYKQCGFIMFFDELFSGNWDINANIGGNKSYKMAEYSTEEKARKAMEMLRDRYTGRDEPVFEIAHVKRNSTDNFYFQFPADDELEV